MALIYRLSGDINALHVDPDFAKAAGFPRPMLHGLATFGVAGHALLKAVCGYDPARLTAMAGRFSAPVFPGETIRTEFWRDGNVVSFRARVMERDVIAIDHGRAEVTAMSKRSAQADDHADIRESVRALCAKFPGEYWRALDRERAYPTEFVAALTEAGYLAALIPEEYGGSGLGISAAARSWKRCMPPAATAPPATRRCTPWARSCGTAAPTQKQRYLPKIASGELRLQAFGVTEPTSGTDTLSLRTTARREGNDHYVINGQKIWTSRAEHSDLMLLLGAHHAEASRPRSAPTGCRCSSSTCSSRNRPASPSTRSAP